eukprot:bmy_19618T0
MTSCTTHQRTDFRSRPRNAEGEHSPAGLRAAQPRGTQSRTSLPCPAPSAPATRGWSTLHARLEEWTISRRQNRSLEKRSEGVVDLEDVSSKVMSLMKVYMQHLRVSKSLITPDSGYLGEGLLNAN